MTNASAAIDAAKSEPSLLARLLRPSGSWRCSLCLVLVIAFFSFTAENFFSVRNMTNVLGQASLALIAGIGCAIVFISGEVDISIGSLLATIALPLILIMNDTGSLALGVSGALLFGLIIGVGERLSDGLCRHQLADRDAGHDVHHARRRLSLHRPAGHPGRCQPSTASSRCRTAACSTSSPIRRSSRIILLVVFAYMMRHRPFGRQIYAVGGNPEVARLAGYDVRRVKFICFIISALLATVAGIILAARVGSAQHTAGLNFEFQVVAATVLGGVSLAGGIGSLTRHGARRADPAVPVQRPARARPADRVATGHHRHDHHRGRRLRRGEAPAREWRLTWLV